MAVTITILPEPLANKIAAGEVVQRPANAVKELIENAVDAKASLLTVIVKDGGKLFIHVIDDGIGMSSEDAQMAFSRHATSKISTYEDLEAIRTLGFRGEALAAISAVAHVELKTRERNSEIGTLVHVEGGSPVNASPCATATGTSILVRNLFYNTPGRRHFLKNNTTEFKHIYDAVQRIAISHPSMALKFISDDELVLNLQQATSAERVKDIFGEKLFSTLVSLEEGSDLMRVRGFLGRPDFARKSRAEQYLFLNDRYIINRNINHAVFQAYEHLLEKGSFPFFILFLTVDPKRVDVNVHPTKMEVKFEDEGAVYRWVLSSVRKALVGHDLIPSVGMSPVTLDGRNAGLHFTTSAEKPPPRATPWGTLLQPKTSGLDDGLSGWPAIPATEALHGALRLPQPEQISVVSMDGHVPVPQRPSQAIGESSRRQMSGDAAGEVTPQVWQLHHKYIMVAIEGGLMLIDQHAAHERVIYERTVVRFKEQKSRSQQLLFPHTLEMTAGDAALVSDLRPLLEQIGFTLKSFGKTTVILDGVPVDIRPGEEGTILQQIVDLYKEDGNNLKLEPRERLAKSYSCKAAVKKGDCLNVPEMQSLLDQLFKTEVPYVCPHGRPAVVKLSIAELDKRFGRTS